MSGASEQKASEGAKENEIDMSKYVSKEEHDRAVSAKTGEMEQLRRELDDAKLSLLDPSYVAYLESKKNVDAKVKDVKSQLKADDLDKNEIATLKEELRELKMMSHGLSAVLELQAVEKKYGEDFEKHREATKKIITSSKTELTIEQAYLIAKSQDTSGSEKNEDAKKAEVKTGREKPGATVPAGAVEIKAYKTSQEALDAAWEQVVGPGKTEL